MAQRSSCRACLTTAKRRLSLVRPYCLFFARTQVTQHASIGRSRIQRDERDIRSYQITQAICWMLQTNDVAFEALGRRRKPKLSPVVRRPGTCTRRMASKHSIHLRTYKAVGKITNIANRTISSALRTVSREFGGICGFSTVRARYHS